MIGLDAATGSGFTAIRLAKKIGKVYALDMVDNMLLETEKLAEENGLHNVFPVKGYVDSMPFENEKFDIVTCRRAAHHFDDKDEFASEAFSIIFRIFGKEFFCIAIFIHGVQPLIWLTICYLKLQNWLKKTGCIMYSL